MTESTLPSLSEGDRVALLAPPSTSYVALVLALLRAGVFPIPLDPNLTRAERAPILADLEPTLVVESAAELDALLAAVPAVDGPPLGRPIHVTSGTTGRPKGVWSGLLDREGAEHLVAEERDLWDFRADDVNLVLSPLHHSAPLRFAMGTLLAGGTVLHVGRFDPAAHTAAITERRPTSMFCVPAHLQRLFDHWDEVGTPNLGSFRLVAHAGAPCPPDLKRRLVEAFPPGSTWEFYGSTEGQFTACRSEDQFSRPGSVGPARPGRTITADDGGVLWCAVPEHARFSYVNAPEKTAAAWRETADGPAFTVGDVGRLDADGWVYLDGRREDLIISGGVNVYPFEVELALREAAGVEDVAVFGVPDPRWGQRVCAAYVGTAEQSALEAHCRERLSPAKRPKEYHRLAQLPRTSTGKVRRLDLPALVSNA